MGWRWGTNLCGILLALAVQGVVAPSGLAATPAATAPAKPNVPARSAQSLQEARRLLDDYRGQADMLERARRLLQSVIAASPDSAEAYRELARYDILAGYISYMNFRPGSLEDAETALHKALEIDPRYADAYVLVGHLYRLMNRPGEAAAALDEAEALGTTDPWLQINRADLLMDAGSFDAAERLYRSVVDSQTPNRKALGAALEGLIQYDRSTGKLADADIGYKRKIAFEPNNPWSHGNYAFFLLCSRDDYDDAIVQARAALQLLDYPMGRTTLAAALYRKWAERVQEGEPREAEQVRHEAERMRPGPPSAVLGELCGEGRPLNAVVTSARLEDEHRE